MLRKALYSHLYNVLDGDLSNNQLSTYLRGDDAESDLNFLINNMKKYK